MFGKNIIVKPIWKIDNARRAALLGQELFVHSIWPTIQGEGPHAGEPAIFIRLTGCNLRCTFCDTEFETGTNMTLDEIVKKVKTMIETCQTDLVVLTGGEPMRQQIIPLLARFDDMGLLTQIETAGTVWPPDAHTNDDAPMVSLEKLIRGGGVELVCSPKTPAVHEKIIDHCNHFKYIIRKGETAADGLPMMSTQVKGKASAIYRPDPDNVLPTIWIQPCQEYLPRDEALGDAQFRNIDEFSTLKNYEEVVRIAMKHGHRISLQTHRLLGVD